MGATRVPYKIEIYQGRANQDRDEPLGTRVVENALEICKNPKDRSSFQAIHLCDIKSKRFRAAGTMRNDRINNYSLVDVKKM